MESKLTMATDSMTGEDYYKKFVAYHLPDSIHVAPAAAFTLAAADGLEKSNCLR